MNGCLMTSINRHDTQIHTNKKMTKRKLIVKINKNFRLKQQTS